ncbi:Translation initiation factor IF-2 [Pleurostoma richardsiae]|uniref:Translation initiation factor IF-2 n=1 Tax=Pleurostoma richardsiae TaxID=41990 RepID=A0AA38VNG2_9PEZI|nr:Translation initiation factor IF-2 [Pleurostoma richardsiae]
MHHQHVRFHAAARRDWDDFTGAVESALNQVNPFQKAADPQTIYKTVYTTMTPDNWDGTAAGWTTLAPSDRDTETTAAHSTLSETAITTTRKSAATTAVSTETLIQDTASLPKSIVPSTASGVATSLALATDSPTPTSQSFSSPSPTSDASATSTADTGSSNSPGTSTAAKAGIAIGVLAGVFVVFALVYFVFSRRRRQMEKQRLDDDEKVNGPFSDRNEIPRTPASAPRLSLRPVTQFLPTLSTHQHPDRRTSRGAAIAMVSSPTVNRPAGSSAWERPMTTIDTKSADPFGNDAERVQTPITENQLAGSLKPSSTLSHDAPVGVATTTNSPPDVSVLATAAGTGASGASLTRKASVRRDGPKPLDLTVPPPLSPVPPSPAGTEFSISSISPGQAPGPSASAAAIAAAGGPAASTVHRVQLDFKPTLEDEMGLKAGQLVRLLHEYDDGWALCIRLDRSQQGVVPRTCLSTRPVKPRPAQRRPFGLPVNPQRGPHHPQAQRPMTPQAASAHPRPMSPAGLMGGRPQSPAGRSASPYDGRPSRPHSPGLRPQSPGGRNPAGHPQSPSGIDRRMTPPSPRLTNKEYRQSPPTGSVSRKPVPGQAY